MTSKTVLLNDKFIRTVLLVLFLFPRNILLALFAVITGMRPVQFPCKVFLPRDLPRMKLLLAQQPFLHELIDKTILEVHSHWLANRPFVAVVVLRGGIIPVSLFDRIADKLKQPDRPRTILVQPEECPHKVLCAPRSICIEVLSVYTQNLRDFVQQVFLRNTVIRFVLGNAIILLTADWRSVHLQFQ